LQFARNLATFLTARRLYFLPESGDSAFLRKVGKFIP